MCPQALVLFGGKFQPRGRFTFKAAFKDAVRFADVCPYFFNFVFLNTDLIS
jgi:hypothetical protein